MTQRSPGNHELWRRFVAGSSTPELPAQADLSAYRLGALDEDASETVELWLARHPGLIDTAFGRWPSTRAAHVVTTGAVLGALMIIGIAGMETLSAVDHTANPLDTIFQLEHIFEEETP